jgi:N-acetylglucosaminyl-diphospho-decaprenol L-rhamnosyltransferase
MTPDLSIIVVTFNGREQALLTLRSARDAVGEASVEWIVVDSGSTDGTPDAIARAFPDVVVVRSENRGFAAGNNVGLRMARGRYVLLMNPDIEIQSGTLAELVVEMDARPDVGIGSVVQVGTDGALQHSIRRFPSPVRDLGEALGASHWPILAAQQELETRPAVYARECSVDWLVGAFLMARREAVAAVGPMDEAFFLYSEEVDWCYRFRQRGWDIRHLPTMTIIHHAGRRDRGDLMAQLAHSRKLFSQKHFSPRRSLQIRCALALGHVVRLVALSPRAAAGDRGARQRLRAEWRALMVQLGVSEPPYSGVQHGALASATVAVSDPRRPSAPASDGTHSARATVGQ